MTVIAVWDSETNGLLKAKREKDGSIHPPMDKHHMISTIEFNEKLAETARWVAYDSPLLVCPAGWEKLSLVEGVKRLETADMRVAHNGQDFDERALLKTFPWFKPKGSSIVIDTLLWSRLLFPDIYRTGPNSGLLNGFLRNAHSVKAWGQRLGEPKDEYKGGWEVLSQEMLDYGCQDTVVLAKIFRYMNALKPPPLASQIEHGFAAIIRRQEDRGFTVYMDKLLALLEKLTTREAELESRLIEEFGSWWEYGKSAHTGAGTAKESSSFEDDDEGLDDPEEQEKRRKEWEQRQRFTDVIVPTKSRNVKMLGFPDITIPKFSEKTGKPLKPYIGPPLISYTQGAAYTPVKRVQFNPSSRSHIRKRFIAKYQWRPEKFTKGGKNSPPQPMVDDSVLQSLPFPEAKRLAEYYLVLKRIGMVATGKKAWLKVAVEYPQPNGTSIWRIHGRVNTCGAIGGRCTHSDPNLAQVPANHSGQEEYPEQPYLWGSACRECFGAAPGYELVGFDASALELRMEAHYVYPWDKGAYAKTVDEGRKEDRTDPHSFLCMLVGEDLLGPVTGAGRDNAKTLKYATLYGAGKRKAGSIVVPYGTEHEQVALGSKIMAAMESGFTAETSLKKTIANIWEEKKFLIGLDGRKLPVRKPHAALNTLLQSAGAVTMKVALIELDKALQSKGMIPGRDYEFVANVHDEAQAEVLPRHVETFMSTATWAVEEAGRRLGLKCPLKAEAARGHSWAETH